MTLTTAITDITPITTPNSVSIVRSLCAQRLAVAISTASPKAIDVFRGTRLTLLSIIRGRAEGDFA